MTKRKRLADREVFTTGDIAKLCGVTIRTVIRWFEEGGLQGYKIPGSGNRRVPRENLIEFLRSHDMPLGELESRGRPRVLLVDDDESVLEIVRSFLAEQDGYEIEVASNAYQAGALTVSFQPDLLIVDYNLGDSTGLDVAQTVRANPSLERTRILCMSGYLTGAKVDHVLENGVDDFIPKPLDLADLGRRVERLLGTSTER